MQTSVWFSEIMKLQLPAGLSIASPAPLPFYCFSFVLRSYEPPWKKKRQPRTNLPNLLILTTSLLLGKHIYCYSFLQKNYFTYLSQEQWPWLPRALAGDEKQVQLFLFSRRMRSVLHVGVTPWGENTVGNGDGL